MPIITLLSDFGLVDPYVAEMKATILSICPNASIVDISHGVNKYDIRMGAFLLASAAPYFPAGSVHIAVVDPSVGGKRRPIVVKTKKSVYVGPDNGLLMLAAMNEGIMNVYQISNRSLMRESVSATFHGRDVFAPVAANIARGIELEKVGREITDYHVPKYVTAKVAKRAVECEVLHIDSFGNMVTNAPSSFLERLDVKPKAGVSLTMRRRRVATRLCRTYSDATLGDFLVLVGSHGFIEVAVNQGDAAGKLGARVGAKLKLLFRD